MMDTYELNFDNAESVLGRLLGYKLADFGVVGVKLASINEITLIFEDKTRVKISPMDLENLLEVEVHTPENDE